MAMYIKNSKAPLAVDIQDDKLVISIGIDTLVHAAENCPQFFALKYEELGSAQYPPYVKVTNKKEFISDVIRELKDEEENGATLVHDLLDSIFVSTYDNGSLGFEDDNR